MRRILLLGSTGPTGQHVLAQAVSAGLEITVVVRDERKLQADHGTVRIVRGDIVKDPSILEAATDGQHAVISTLGVGRSFQPAGLIAYTAPRIVAAMERYGVQRLVFTSAFGVGETWSQTPLVPRIFMRTLLRRIYADKEAGEAAIRRSALDWTLVHPTGLTDGPATGTYRFGERVALTGFPRISRADVAAALLRFVNDPATVRKSLLVSQ